MESSCSSRTRQRPNFLSQLPNRATRVGNLISPLARHRDFILAVGLFVTTFLVYAPAWNGGLIWDDDLHITRPELRSLHGLARIWTDPAAAPQYYPLLHTLFWVEYRMWDG